MSRVVEQYKTASNLGARIALHTRFSRNSVAWFPWVFSKLTLPAGARVLELGTGPAKLWRENLERVPESWHITLADFSPGMVAEAKEYLKGSGETFAFQVADAQALPFADASFGAVIANHMLYHVPDLPRALAKIRRVLKPKGRLFAATNGREHMRELDELSRPLIPQGIFSAFAEVSHVTDFSLETAPERLEPYFSSVTLHRPEGDPDLYVTEAEPVVAYILSSVSAAERADTKRVAALREHVEERLGAAGEIRITRATGLFEARV